MTDLLSLFAAGVGPDSELSTDASSVAATNTTELISLFGPNISTKNVVEYCMTFNGDTAYDGTVCLEMNVVLNGEILTSFSSEPQECTLGYQDQSEMCTNCQFVGLTGCLTADCSAVTGVDGIVDSCAGTGLTGPFQFLDSSLPTTSTCTGTTVVTTDGESSGNIVTTTTVFGMVASLASLLWVMA